MHKWAKTIKSSGFSLPLEKTFRFPACKQQFWILCIELTEVSAIFKAKKRIKVRVVARRSVERAWITRRVKV